MKKSSAPKKASAIKVVAPAAVGDVDLAVVRQQIRNRVGKEALAMVEATIDAVKEGQYTALKYLFEAVALFPAEVASGSQSRDVLAPTLLQALGLPEIPPAELAVTKDRGGVKTFADHTVE